MLRKTRKNDLFDCGRICKYCGVNMDTTDLESLKFLHGKCWEEYRKNGELYPLSLKTFKMIRVLA